MTEQATPSETKTTTLADLIAQVGSGAMTVDQAVDEIDSRHDMIYAVKYFEPRGEAQFPYWDILREWKRRRIFEDAHMADARVLAPVEMVRCSCGHTVPRDEVMNASLGSSCPDCYDRLS